MAENQNFSFYGRPAEIIEELPRWGDIVIIRWQSVSEPMNVTTHRNNLKFSKQPQLDFDKRN